MMKYICLLFMFLSACSNNEPKTTSRDEATNIVFYDSSIQILEDNEVLIDSIEQDYYADYPVLDSVAVGINFTMRADYISLKRRLKAKQIQIKQDYLLLNDSILERSFRDSVALLLTDILINDYFPHWYGTDWDYEGITEKPREGSIACGYFVSTTLKHLGFNLNRYKFAQQSGLNGAKTIQMGEELRIFYPRDQYDITKTLVVNLKPGLYQVGLSCHVGYLLIKNNNAYFIHSNYYHSGVMIELAADSDAFVSNIYVISDITFNDKLIKKWIMQEQIVIIRT